MNSHQKPTNHIQPNEQTTMTTLAKQHGMRSFDLLSCENILQLALNLRVLVSKQFVDVSKKFCGPVCTTRDWNVQVCVPHHVTPGKLVSNKTRSPGTHECYPTPYEGVICRLIRLISAVSNKMRHSRSCARRGLSCLPVVDIHWPVTCLMRLLSMRQKKFQKGEKDTFVLLRSFGM